MKRRIFIKDVSLAGAAVTLPAFAINCSLPQKESKTIPAVHLTQQDFVSTFPWGIRGDRVRILQQEVENELLDTETLAAFAFMLGLKNASSRLDEAWKLMLNSQNHDVHVCLADETGIEWCKQSQKLATEIRDGLLKFLAGKINSSSVAINTLPWSRNLGEDNDEVPGFGYAVLNNSGKSENKETLPWNNWFETDSFKIRVSKDGCLETLIGNRLSNPASIGYMTLYSGGSQFDTRTDKPKKIKNWLSKDKSTAFAEIEGEINGLSYVHKIVANGQYIDYETTIDYGDGSYFGPEPADIEENPHRVHYYQHERKLCINCDISEASSNILQNTPYLTWPADKSKSIESLNYLAMESDKGNIAHFNIGQSGYGYEEENSCIKHVISFAPKRYVYGNGKQILKGKETYRNRFIPYSGDWRTARITLLSNEYQRPVIELQSKKIQSDLPEKASFLNINSNTTIATALFERGGKIYVRLWEWAGQKDEVSIQFGDSNASLIECSHNLVQSEKLATQFNMRPWEIKTIELDGAMILLGDRSECSVAQSLNAEPEGWSLPNYFTATLPGKASSSKISDDNKVVYFSSGYHDGFVKPIERHTKTMAIEMDRISSGKYPNYASTWEIGGSCWVQMNKNEPEYLEKLKPFLKDGSIEIVGGTWCEPLNLIVNGESIMRQFLYGTEAIEKNLDTKVTIYSNQEHGTFAQMPQILKSFGIKAAVNRTQWAPYGYESGLDTEIAEWVGVDGSSIYVIPRYNSMDYLTLGPNNGQELQYGSVTGHNRFWRTEAKFKELLESAQEKGVQKPLMTMLEDIWAEEWRSTDEEMDFYLSLPYVKFISIGKYLSLFGIELDENK
ncbi:hypothetical protein ACUNWD_10430 [Sunxiuqinia sp. A32]|uniref:glycoside hydrolase family 38 N-terminal domain-containing protein n=1 Tax=Sunxiuqinia sp. A32 TaxID=3461496 RepID=UPI004045D380